LDVNNKGAKDAKKGLGNGKFGEGFGFTSQVKVSDLVEMASIALFLAFASSCLRCSIAASRFTHLRRPVQVAHALAQALPALPACRGSSIQ
jgi:hypothetical protein